MFRTALRNIGRNRRRTVVMLVSVIAAAFLVSGLRFLGYGMHQQMIWNSAGLLSGYVQISGYGWLESRAIDRALDVPLTLEEQVSGFPGVARVAPRIEGPALVSAGAESRFVTVTGIDPNRERGMVGIEQRVVKGSYLSAAAPRSAVIGERLARFLDLAPGDSLFLVTSQFDGSVGALELRVAGVFRTGSSQLDFGQVLVPLGAAQELFAPNTPATAGGPPVRRFTSLLLGVHSEPAARRLLAELRLRFPRPEPEPGVAAQDSTSYVPVVHSWEDLNPELVQMMALDQIGNEVWIAFLILIMSFGILNSVQMSVHERTHEFAVLLAIGTRGGWLLGMVFLEALLLLLPGTAVGVLLGVALGAYLQANPIPISGEAAKLYEEFGFEPLIQAVPDTGELWIAVVSLLLPALLLLYLGARRVLRLQPGNILRSTG